MKAVFLGGGSLRLLPILRSVFEKVPEFFRGGEIRLVDLKMERAEAVGKLLLACPEYANVGCRVIWTDDLDSALEGIDVLYLTMAARRDPSETQAVFLSNRYGYYSSDNLSVNGAFLSLRIGRTIFNIAKKMEKICPDALMLIFPNPVAVYSHMVNTFTKVRALGICGGFNNHRYDLTRLTGHDGFDPGWDVVAAGVNHLSYILRGSYRGEDLYSEVLPRYLTARWKPVETESPYEWARDGMRQGQIFLYRMFRRYGKLIFSTEGDGAAHIFPEESIQLQIRRFGRGENYDPAPVAQQVKEAERARFAPFIESSKEPAKIDWTAPGGYYGKIDADITIPIFRALAGTAKMRIVASRPNGGAVRDFGPEAPLEYTMDIFGKSVTPVEDQYIPAPFYGLTASLAEFQRLQSEAIAKWEPEIFADALDAYPVHRFAKHRKEFFREMFALYADLDSHMLGGVQYFQD